ncbi:MAG: sugar ABC transporter substrate-binding protein [Pseudonocardiales bacterium]|nr:MAG: sugar ABC transporter substrate-binding protein [Pseudonocardiales bacterium]
MKQLSRTASVPIALVTVLATVTACTSGTSTKGGKHSAGGTGTTCSATGTSTDAGVSAAQQALAKAAGTSSKWDGPTSGPKAQHRGATVVFIPLTSANAGDVGVQNGFKEAAAALGWKVKVIDGGGTTTSTLAALDQAIALKPAAIAVSSFDAKAAQPAFAKAKALGIPVVGNHTGQDPGPQDNAPAMFTNVTSDPTTIAAVAADCAIVASGGKAGVTIVGCGNEVGICATKEDSMKKTIETCGGCTVLDKHDYPFGDATQREGTVATADLQRFGDKLTYMLSINDIYWDAAIPALRAAGVTATEPPHMIAAGDGSPAAFKRIRAGEYQIATVAEPLTEHGWQMADELNRALAGQPPSGFVTYPHIVTKENVDTEGGQQNTYEPSNGYREQYTKLWSGS